jgi:nucleoside-diphosphate-sugar epimerase
MNALVTGANGFLGRYIVEQLVARGDRVRALCRRPFAPFDALGVDTHLGDVRVADKVAAACRDVDVVFHTAAIAGIWGPWNNYYSINVQGTEHVLAGCRQHGVPKLVFTSSPSVTFAGQNQCGIDESTPYPTQWLCHYPHTKALAEQAVLAANSPTLSTCALRPHLIWGPRDQHLIPRLLDRARRGRLRRVGNGDNLIDIVHVANAAQAHLQAADALSPTSAVAGRAYFLSQGEPVNCWQWIDQLLVLAGLPKVSKAILLPAAVRLGSACETVYRLLRLPGEPPMTRFLALQLGTSHYYDISRARIDFGYTPQISTEAGMADLFADTNQS